MGPMQQQPAPWEVPPAQPPRKSVSLLVVVLSLLGIVALMCCGGGLLVWRSGPGEAVTCSNLTVEGSYPEAIPHCRTAATQIPASGIVHNNLAWCLLMVGQVPEGLAEANKAVELDPNLNHYDTLAMALALSGRGKEALKTETEQVLVDGTSRTTLSA